MSRVPVRSPGPFPFTLPIPALGERLQASLAGRPVAVPARAGFSLAVGYRLNAKV